MVSLWVGSVEGVGGRKLRVCAEEGGMRSVHYEVEESGILVQISLLCRVEGNRLVIAWRDGKR